MENKGIVHPATQPAQDDYLKPDVQYTMDPKPEIVKKNYKAGGKLKGKVALVTGGDSGIGRSIAVLFAREGADVAIVYLEAEGDAEETQGIVEQEGRKCLLIKGDVGNESFAKEAVERTAGELGALDILVNNAGEQHYCEKISEITEEQIDRTFRTNLFSVIYFTKASIAHLNQGGSIINTASITAYKGHPALMDYSATKGGIVSFTRALSQNKEILSKGIRVNAVAPGPIWTPLIPATFPKSEVKKFGKDTPLKRAGQPSECAPAYVYLASDDASYVSGQVLHINGGQVVNG